MKILSPREMLAGVAIVFTFVFGIFQYSVSIGWNVSKIKITRSVTLSSDGGKLSSNQAECLTWEQIKQFKFFAPQACATGEKNQMQDDNRSAGYSSKGVGMDYAWDSRGHRAMQLVLSEKAMTKNEFAGVKVSVKIPVADNYTGIAPVKKPPVDWVKAFEQKRQNDEMVKWWTKRMLSAEKVKPPAPIATPKYVMPGSLIAKIPAGAFNPPRPNPMLKAAPATIEQRPLLIGTIGR